MGVSIGHTYTHAPFLWFVYKQPENFNTWISSSLVPVPISGNKLRRTLYMMDVFSVLWLCPVQGVNIIAVVYNQTFESSSQSQPNTYPCSEPVSCYNNVLLWLITMHILWINLLQMGVSIGFWDQGGKLENGTILTYLPAGRNFGYLIQPRELVTP